MNFIIIVTIILFLFICYKLCVFRTEGFGRLYVPDNYEFDDVINIPIEENPDTKYGHLVGKNIHVRLDDKCNVMYEDYLSPPQQGIYGCTQLNCPNNLENKENKTCWLCCNYH